ncbi:MAG: hypothetical protein M3Q36_00140, partial [bacterium]|nr:hypothetical protein [bacterium]
INISNNPEGDLTGSWSPDGTKISFTTDRDGPNSPYNSEAYTMNTDGSAQTRVTNTSVIEDPTYYSPDGRKFLVSVYPDENFASSEVYSMNIDGTNRQQLTNGGGYDNINTSQAWQALPYSQITNTDSSITSVISADKNYSATDYTVESNETLIIDGSLCDITVQAGATLKGTGTACTITVEAGGTVNPGHSPGCLASGNASLSGTYLVEIASTVACTGYDQLQVTGTTTISGTLNLNLLGDFKPDIGTVFTILSNDGSDVVTGTFAGLAEGGSITSGSIVFTISYTGGDGNDVTMTAASVSTSPDLADTGNNANAATVFAVVLLLSSVVAIGLNRRRQYSNGAR